MTTAPRPNVVVVLVDDMGFSDIGCYGGEVETPNVDALAAGGVAMTQFYNTARCSPSRASLMTGLHPHQTGVGILNDDDSPEGYAGRLNRSCVTLAEVLRPAGYATYLSGKWHLSNDVRSPDDAWPTRRGFDEFFGTLEGAGSYFRTRTLTRGEEDVEHLSEDPGFYYTDAITDHAVEFLRTHQRTRADDPFFLYVAYTAPHWPLHALEADIARYAGRFDAGWDVLRTERLARMVERGIVSGEWVLTGRDPAAPAWEDVTEREWEAARMAVYAAQIDRMDQGVGRIVAQLDAQGVREDTLVVFLSDNGGCAEELPVQDAGDFLGGDLVFDARTRDGREVRPGNDPSTWPGGEDSYASCGLPWANLSNTPFREYKHWVHEGGIATPLVAHWPAGLPARGELRHQPHQLTDIMSTVLEVSGAAYPTEHQGHPVLPPEGRSMLGTWAEDAPAEDRHLHWEHEGNAGVRRGPWKLVRKHGREWELFDLDADRTELHDLSADHPERVRELAAAHQEWATRCGVIPRERVLELYASRVRGRSSE